MTRHLAVPEGERCYNCSGPATLHDAQGVPVCQGCWDELFPPDALADVPAWAIGTLEVTDPHPVFPWLTQARRGWLYRVTLAAGALAGLYGLASANEVAGWVGLTAALLSVTPSAHTPVK